MNETATWETAAFPPGLGVRQALLGAQAGTSRVNKGAVKQGFVQELSGSHLSPYLDTPIST